MSENKYFEGTIQVTSRGKGFVFVEGIEGEIEIAKENLGTALHGDRVLVDPKKRQVVKIITRIKEKFVGTIEKQNGKFYLSPQDYRVYKKIYIPDENIRGADLGHKALVRIVEWIDPEKDPRGEVVTVIGKSGLHETEMQAIALDKGIIFSFSKKVEEEAQGIKKRAPELFKTEEGKRKDFRNIPTFTIDPVDAKDFDDALSIQKLPNGNFEVGVHIADPSFYISEGSAIDEEAAKRTTSVYLVDRTIPMLPEVLSNDLCSLNPDEDKLAFSFVCEITREGTVQKQWFGKTMIRSKKRFSYEEAQAVLDTKTGPYSEELSLLNALAEKLRAKRFEKGALTFNQEEVRFKLAPDGRPLEIYKKKHLPTNDLIEDWMLLANSAVAEFAASHDTNVEATFIYRVHPLPSEDKIKELVRLMRALGYNPPKKNLPKTSAEIARLVESVAGSPEESVVHMATIQAMERAIYSTQNIGHFGLSMKHYTHFTSPIRRYPDMVVHRLLATYLGGSKPPKEKLAEYEALSRYVSHMERIAQEAEWASIKYKQTEYMAERIGRVYDGMITGINERGIFVRENNTFAEGMIRFRDMKDDYYIYDEKTLTARGQKKKKSYRLGDKVRIKVLRTNLEKRFIDYEIV